MLAVRVQAESRNVSGVSGKIQRGEQPVSAGLDINRVKLPQSALTLRVTDHPVNLGAIFGKRESQKSASGQYAGGLPSGEIMEVPSHAHSVGRGRYGRVGRRDAPTDVSGVHGRNPSAPEHAARAIGWTNVRVARFATQKPSRIRCQHSLCVG